MNKETKSDCLQANFYNNDGEYISIIDGTKGDSNIIKWIEIFYMNDEIRYSNFVEAEIKLLTLQY